MSKPDKTKADPGIYPYLEKVILENRESFYGMHPRDRNALIQAIAAKDGMQGASNQRIWTTFGLLRSKGLLEPGPRKPEGGYKKFSRWRSRGKGRNGKTHTFTKGPVTVDSELLDRLEALSVKYPIHEIRLCLEALESKR